MANILIIEDDSSSRMYLVALLKNAGHSVQEAENGQQCIEQLNQYHSDLIITDIFMPTMDGFELLTALKKGHPDSKVIAMSGGGAKMTRRLILHMAMKLGAVDCINKPFKSENVINTVARVLLIRQTVQ
ncbi:MAG: response regulator [Magnetococcus sp. YQC-5]